jgi:hypothetical protein
VADGAAAAYVCAAMVCALPARTLDAFREQLGGSPPARAGATDRP